MLDGDGFNGRVDYSASGNVTINGNVHTVISTLGAQGSTTSTDLQGINGALGGYYILGASIDASATSGWNAGAGFDPIGGTFTGDFNGLGHNITGLTIDRTGTENVGLFGYTSGGDISNVGLVNVDVDSLANAGGLVGYSNNSSSVINSYATGVVGGLSRIGGLIGWSRNSSSINSSYATATVNGSDDHHGGLVGVNEISATITSSYATGTINGNRNVGSLVGYNAFSSSITGSYATGPASGTERIGGLVGQNNNSSSITSSYATGDVDGTVSVGGLVGLGNNSSSVTSSYATGDVDGTSTVGGLVGMIDNSSSVSLSYATGDVSSTQFNVGGLVGYVIRSSSVASSYATGTVTGNNRVGGLVGTHNHLTSITSSYATGAVSGTDMVGGLVGLLASNGLSITDSYAVGGVSGTSNIGGLVGGGSSATITMTDSFWDTQTTGQAISYGGAGAVGRTTAQMQTLSTFTDATWDFYDDWAFHPTVNNNYPVLRNFFTELDVTLLQSTSKTYGGVNTLSLGFDYSVSGCSGCLSLTLGAGATNAGTYSYGNGSSLGTANLFSNVFNTGTVADYIVDYNYGDGSLNTTVNKATLTVTANSLTREYGDTNPSLTASITGFQLTDDINDIDTAPTYNTAATQNSNAGTYSITGSGGVDNNYDFSYVNGNLTIDKAELTITANNATRTYGDANPSLTGSISGFKLTDDVNDLGTTPTYSTAATQSSNAGSYSISASGGVDTNYSFSYVAGSLSVTKATLTATLLDDSPSRQAGRANPDFDISYSGFKVSDSVSSLDVAPLATTLANIGSRAGSYNITLSGGSDSNYNIIYTNPVGTLTVTPKPASTLPGSVLNADRTAAQSAQGFSTNFFAPRFTPKRFSRSNTRRAKRSSAGSDLKQQAMSQRSATNNETMANKPLVGYDTDSNIPSFFSIIADTPLNAKPAPRMTMMGGLVEVEPEMVAYFGFDRLSEDQQADLGLAIIDDEDDESL